MSCIFGEKRSKPFWRTTQNLLILALLERQFLNLIGEFNTKHWCFTII